MSTTPAGWEILSLPFLRCGNGKGKISQSRSVLLGKPSYGILGLHCGLFDEIWDVESAAFSCLYAPETAIPLSIKEKLSAVRSALLFTATDSPVLARFRTIRNAATPVSGPISASNVFISAIIICHFSARGLRRRRPISLQWPLIPISKARRTGCLTELEPLLHCTRAAAVRKRTGPRSGILIWRKIGCKEDSASCGSWGLRKRHFRQAPGTGLFGKLRCLFSFMFYHVAHCMSATTPGFPILPRPRARPASCCSGRPIRRCGGPGEKTLP